MKALAALDEPDHLAVTLYGKLTAGMTPNTFVAGEGHTIDPADGNYFRSMYLPPDLANNDLFLVTLREMLVNVTYDASTVAPTGLRLAHSTPRGWLENGKSIEVQSAPTPFGEVSYEITSSLATDEVQVSVAIPTGTGMSDISLRLRLPNGYTIVSAHLPDATPVPVSGETLDLTGLAGTVTVEVDVTN